MDTAPQPTDEAPALDATGGLLERARLFILDMMAFVDGIFGRLDGVPLSVKLARHLTRYALIPAKPRAAPDATKPRAAPPLPQKTASPASA